MHTGTHIDAPLHDREEERGSRVYPIWKDLFLLVKSLDFTHIDDAITKDDLINKEFESGEFLLFKTKLLG